MYTLYKDRHVVDLVVPVRVEDTVNKLVPSAAPCFFALLLGWSPHARLSFCVEMETKSR